VLYNVNVMTDCIKSVIKGEIIIMNKFGKASIIVLLTAALVALNASEDKIKQMIVENATAKQEGAIVDTGSDTVLVTNNNNPIETIEEINDILKEEGLDMVEVETTQLESDTSLEKTESVDTKSDNSLEEIKDEKQPEENQIEVESVESEEDDLVEIEDTNEEKPMFLSVGHNTSGQQYIDGQITINNANGFMLSQELIDSTMSTIKGTNKRVSFYITDPETNMTISYNAHMDMQPASSVKAGGALLACKMVDEGTLSFDTEYTYTSQYYNDGSGTIKLDKYGTKYTLRDLVHRCIHESDNIAYAMIVDIIGKDNYNNMIIELGGTHTLNQWQNYGYHSAQDLNLVWQEIYRSDREAGKELYSKKLAGEVVDESEYSACAILNYEFLDAKYNFLQNCISYPSCHKSGFSGGSYNDSGIVETETGDLIVTIMTNGENYLNAQRFNAVGSEVDKMIDEICLYKSMQNDKNQESLEA